MKTRGRKPKAANAVPMKPNPNHQRGRQGMAAVPPTTNNSYSHALHYFIKLQNQHITRLRYLFPEINPAALRKLLDLCEGDLIRTIDNIFDIRRRRSMQGKNIPVPVNKASSAGSFISSTTMSYPNTATLSPCNSSTAKESVIMPVVQTSFRMPPDIQTVPSNYHVNQYPVMNSTNATNVSNNAMFMPTSVFAQRPNLSSLAKNIQSPNTFSDIQSVSYPALSNHRTTTSLPISPSCRTSTLKHLDPMLFLNSSHSDVPQLNSDTITGIKSDLYHQYAMESPQMVRPDSVSTVTQGIDYNLLAESNVGEQPGVTTNQATYQITPEIFAQREQESWLQQEQQYIQLKEQKQYEEKQLFEFMNSVQPLNTSLLPEDLEQADVPLLPLQYFQETVAPPIQTTSTVADVQYQDGTLQYEHNQYNTDTMRNKDSGMMLNLNVAITDHNQECSRGVQNYYNSYNAESSQKKNVNVCVKRKLFHHSQRGDGLFSSDDAGTFEESKTFINNDVGMLSETKPNTKPVTEEAQAFSITTSGTDLNKKFTAEDSSPLKKENENFITGNNKLGLDETPHSADTCLVNDRDTE